jgi:hypothetical protein
MNITRQVTLNPGFTFRNQRITTCEVRLLTRAQRKAIAQEKEADKRDDLLLGQSIVRFSNIENANDIADALDYLLYADEERIEKALSDLENQFKDAPDPEPLKVQKIVRSTDILSPVFALNPGIRVDGKEIKSCVVRLLTRSEARQVASEPDESVADDLALYFSIVQMGSLTNVTLEHINMLTGPDEIRIKEAMAALRESFRPSPRYTCPRCSHTF